MAKVRKRGKTWQIDYFDPNGKRVRKAFKKKKDAEAELAKRVSLIAEGRYLDVKRECTTVLKVLLDKYEENHKHQPSYKTCKQYFIDDIRSRFGDDTLISNIRYVDLETYRNHLMNTLTKHKKKRSVATVNKAIGCLRHVFTKAVEWEMVESSPFDKGRPLVRKENNKRLRFLTEEEIPKLLNACPVYLRNIVECTLNTGMRRGEVLSLKWDQVRNGFIYLTKTKTNEARQIPINKDLDNLFKRIRKKDHLTTEYVFNYQGTPVADVKKAFATALKKAGIVDFRFHDLRHTFASHFAMRGGSLKDLQELLGHRTMTMTLRYAHLTQEHKKKAVNLLNGLTASKIICHKTVTSQNPSKCSSL
ncbi:integrase [Desulfosarcina widdelii]|uniref:Integrase n=1 Tax=Desulfosarcina widdelii TaxID=947919 RepID=A0A5K7Z8G9_9BACT|nr:site-specific integrase [Desulfosarcina widdelii]BBO76153.1 integrase [Desulfosarcina widdelii]